MHTSISQHPVTWTFTFDPIDTILDLHVTSTKFSFQYNKNGPCIISHALFGIADNTDG